MKPPVYIHMPYGAFGDQLAFIGAARMYAKRHPHQQIYVDVLHDIVQSYADTLLMPLAVCPMPKPLRIDFECVQRHRKKHSSQDINYVGCYYGAINDAVHPVWFLDEPPHFEPPELPPHPALSPGNYIAVQPYSTFARNAKDRDAYVQALIDQCHMVDPHCPVYCIGREDTRRDLKGISYKYLGWARDTMRLIQHARYVLTPRSASAHIAAGYRVPSFVWVCGDGEDWHLDYPHWPHTRVSVDLSPAAAAEQLKQFLTKGTSPMGDVERVLASRNMMTMQKPMHDRIVLEACENIHFHWRNTRIEMSLSDAARMLDIFWWGSSKIMSAIAGKVVPIPLDAICPYNNSHKRTADGSFENESPAATQEHKDGIAWMVQEMKAGKKIRPIAVRPAWHGRFPRPQDKKSGNIWQRLDGFKRYMAHRELGREFIDCFIIDGDQPGCQHNQPAFLKPNERFEPAFGKDFFVETGKDNLSCGLDADKQRYFENQVELLKNGIVHVHIGDARLEFERNEFREYASMICQAAHELFGDGK